MRNTTLRPPDFAFGLEVSVDGGRWVVAVKGDLDCATAGRLRACLHILHDEGAAVVVDLARVDFIDSVGVGVLVGAWRAAQARSQQFALRAPSAAVARVLDLTGISELAEHGR